VIEAVFLGTGNFLAPGRYWNSFVLDGSVLVEPSPTALPNLRRCGMTVDALDVVVISHFHADHTFGWPFLLLEFARSRRRSSRALFVVGPPDLEGFLAAMLQVGGVPNVQEAARSLDLRYLEVDGTWQDAGGFRFRAVEVDHVDHLRCFGYLFEFGARIIGYSGDTRPCPGLDELAAAADVLILECNSAHPPQPPLPLTHMDLASVQSLHERFPELPLVLTHIGADVEASAMVSAAIPDDLERMTI
jgi:ribonuclease Z